MHSRCLREGPAQRRLPRRPRFPWPLLLLGLLASCAHDFSDGLVRGERAPRAGLLDLASELRDAQDLATATALYHRAIIADPTDPEPLVALGEVLLEAGDAFRAGGAFREVLLISPGHRRAVLGLARSFLAAEQPAEAASLLAPLAGDSDPTVAAAYGAALDLMGRHAEAQQLYADALAQAPRHLGLRTNLALSLAFSGETEGAVAEMKAAAAAPDAGPAQLRNLVFILALDGQPEAARMFGASAGLTAAQAEEIIRLADQAMALEDGASRMRLIGVFGS